MDGQLPFYRDPKKQIIIVVLAVVIIYVLLLGRQGIATDVLLVGDYTFVSGGSYGGVRVLNVQNPQKPVQIGYVDTPGADNRVTLAGSYLYVADGDAGLGVINVSNPNLPNITSQLGVQGDVQDVAVTGQYAFLAAGGEGLVVVDISKPGSPLKVASLTMPGAAQAIAVMQVYISPHPPQNPEVAPQGQQISLKFTYALVACGQAGIQVVDITLPMSPVLKNNLDTGGNARDVVIDGPYAYVANGKSGLFVANVSNPLTAYKMGVLPTQGDFQKLAFSGTQVFIANGNQGYVQVDVSNPSSPQTIGAYSLGVTALGIAAGDNNVYLAAGDQGLKILDVANPQAPMAVGSYEMPGTASFTQILRAFWSLAHIRIDQVQSKVWLTLLWIIIDVLLFFVARRIWLSFFAQFVLPVSTYDQRLKVAERLRLYLQGRHGPAIFIENGEIVQRQREFQRRGPGVALLDTASAAVFRTSRAFTRPAGPGVIFTSPGEYPAGTLDLHIRTDHLGPGEGEDPFAPQGPKEQPDIYKDRQNRRYETSGLTRDGVEVVPWISVRFKLNSRPGEGKTYFGYSPQAVWRAIARQGIDPNALPDSEGRHVDWDWLPVHLAVDLWREYLRKFTLDELFRFAESDDHRYMGGRHQTAFDIILEMIKNRMGEEEVPELGDSGKPTGGIVRSKEYEALQERGIKFLSVEIQHLHFPEEVEKKLVEQWNATWLQRAREESEEVKYLQASEKDAGEDLAAKEFAAITSQPLADAVSTNQQIDLEASLELLLEGTQELCSREPELQNRLTDQKANLIELIEWVGKQ